MPLLHDLIGFLDDLLKPGDFADYGPNGLQVPGPEDVVTLVTGVSAHAELLRRAAAVDADLVLVHHGLFWRGQPLEVTPAMHERLKLLYEHRMALAAYHLPLDAHPEHGNNALLAQGLGLTDVVPFSSVGVRGTLPGDGLPAAELAARVEALVDRPPLVLHGGPETIRTLSIVSGAAADDAALAAQLGVDAHLTGEPNERAFGFAADAGVTIIAAGHHATETLGVRRLGDLLAERFGVEHVWVDVPNPI